MSKLKARILFALIIFEMLVILILGLPKIVKNEFMLLKGKTKYSFYVTNLKRNLYVDIDLFDNGDLCNVLVNDNQGRLMSISYDENRIIAYVIRDGKTNYATENFFENDFIKGNRIIARREYFSDVEKKYIVDHSLDPFIITIDDAYKNNFKIKNEQ